MNGPPQEHLKLPSTIGQQLADDLQGRIALKKGEINHLQNLLNALVNLEKIPVALAVAPPPSGPNGKDPDPPDPAPPEPPE